MHEDYSDPLDTVAEDGPADVFGESVTVRSEPFDSFDSFCGYSEEKQRLQETVVEPAGYDQYVTSSVLLVGDHMDCQTTTLAKGLTGEVGEEYTFFHVDSLNREFLEETNSIEATLTAARDHTPSLMIVSCLDEYGFDETEYDQLQTFLESTRQSDERVIVVCTTNDRDVELTTNDSLFEVIVDVPEPDEAFRRGLIEAELDSAEAAGVIEPLGLDSGSLSDLTTHDLSLHGLRTAVKRTVQRRRRESDDERPTITPTHIQESITIVEAEKLEESEGMSLFEDEESYQFDPDIPSVRFDDIGGLTPQKQRLQEAATNPVEYSDTFRKAGYSVGQGILLHGPPGNGKTMMAKAVANDLGYHFLSVKGPELEQPLVGESERQLRELFGTAREHAPSVIFFDEFDSLAPNRRSETPVWKEDLVNTLLSELDGLEPLDDVIVMAATNRLDRLDDAVLRSGRFDTFIEVPMPTDAERREIFSVHIADLPVGDDVTADWFGTLDLSELSGADIMAICRKALEFAVRDFDAGDIERLLVSRTHIRTAMDQLRSDSRDTGSFREIH